MRGQPKASKSLSTFKPFKANFLSLRAWAPAESLMPYVLSPKSLYSFKKTYFINKGSIGFALQWRKC